jgi:hypothetical protein
MSEVSLKEHVEVILEEREKQLAMTRTDLERRLEQMNELRTQINSERGSFVTFVQHNLVTDAIKDLQIWRGNIEGRMLMVGCGVVIVNMVLNGLTVYFILKH